MAHWNYRIVKRLHKYTIGTVDRASYTYGIHEAYYDEAGEVTTITENPKDIQSTLELWDCETEEECLASLQDQLTKMQLAFSKPVLDYDDIGEPKEDNNGL